MNKKGFTLIELITSFSLAGVIIVFLINIVLMLKTSYTNIDLKTELMIKQSQLSNLLNASLVPDNLTSISPCDEDGYCYILKFIDNTEKRLEIKNNTISYDNFTYKMLDGSSINDNIIIEKVTLSVSNVLNNDSLLKIKISIKNNNYPGYDFGINVIYQYNSRVISL